MSVAVYIIIRITSSVIDFKIIIGTVFPKKKKNPLPNPRRFLITVHNYRDDNNKCIVVLTIIQWRIQNHGAIDEKLSEFKIQNSDGAVKIFLKTLHYESVPSDSQFSAFFMFFSHCSPARIVAKNNRRIQFLNTGSA